MAATLQIQVPHEAIAALCRRHHISRLSFFGSALRDDFGPQSDLDLLVEFEPGHAPGLAFFGIQEELARLLGRTVDLNTANDLSPDFRKDVLGAAEPIFEAA